MPLGKLWPNRRGVTRTCGVVTSELGHSRRFRGVSVTSALPPITDFPRKDRRARFVPGAVTVSKERRAALSSQGGGAVGLIDLAAKMNVKVSSTKKESGFEPLSFCFYGQGCPRPSRPRYVPDAGA